VTGPRRGPDALEDRILSARRGALSPAERAELDRALERDPSLRLLLQVGRDFDALVEPHVGDEALVARAARAALKRSSAGLPLVPRRIPTLLGVIAAVLASGILAWAALDPTHWTATRASAPAVATALSPPAAAASVPAPRASQDARFAPPLEADQAPAIDRNPHPKPPVTVRRPGLASETAADVFREAAAARRLGDVDRACSLYLDLQRRFPRSSEAQLSQISLGKLLLQTGRASEADRHFAAYLSSGGGDLAEEALVGRAQSSQQLARREEERRAWDQLLRDHPRSVYAAQAKRRIEELDGATP
jgi:TolA-binding protein